MFERFTDRARRAVVLAQEEARTLSHGYIGTEHLLLGLIREGDGAAARALGALGVSLEAAREQVRSIAGKRRDRESGHIPFTPRAKRVLELSLRESRQLGDDHIGTEHVLLGMVREGEGVAAQVLAGLGVDLDRVREQVLRLVHGPAGEPGAASAGGPGHGRRTGGREIDAVLARLDSAGRRLAALERWVGMEPDVTDLEAEIAQVHREKEAAIESQDFETAAVLRDKEQRLAADKMRREKEWAADSKDRPSLAGEFLRLNAELGRLRRALRERGIEPGDGAA